MSPSPPQPLTVARDADSWRRLARGADVGDVYGSWDFLAAWAREEGAEPLGLAYEDGPNRVLYPVLRVPLDALPGGEGFCDLTTPYDFGGPLVLGPEPHATLQAFELALERLAVDLRVVSEFARLHPLRPSARPAAAEHHADNFVVDLTLDPDELAARQHGAHRGRVRAAKRNRLEFELVGHPDEALVGTWERLYAETMERVRASRHYRFSNTVFRTLSKIPGVRLAAVTLAAEVLSLAMVVDSSDAVFYYLSASNERGRSLRANNFLLDRLIAAARAEGRSTLHLGGGSQSLRGFKGQIATGTVPYFVLRRIHDPIRYRRLSEAVPGSELFPAYREALAGRSDPA